MSQYRSTGIWEGFLGARSRVVTTVGRHAIGKSVRLVVPLRRSKTACPYDISLLCTSHTVDDGRDPIAFFNPFAHDKRRRTKSFSTEVFFAIKVDTESIGDRYTARVEHTVRPHDFGIIEDLYTIPE